jgi:hypothetical protein
VSAPGHPATLVPAPAANTLAAKHGVWSERLREPRAQELYEAIMDAPHLTPLDAIAARQVARLEALIEACEDALASGVTGRGGSVKAAADLMLRAIRRQTELLDRLGLTPSARAEWAARLAGGGLAAEIARRRADREASGV